MIPRTKLFRGLALVAVLGVGVTACDGDDIIIPVEPTIAAQPSQLNLRPGEQQRIVATITGLDNTAATFESTNTNVATVDGNGNVTAVNEGVATITVASAARPSLQTAVGVRVESAELPPSEVANVAIQGVTQGQTTMPVNPAAVSGIIDVALSVERGVADRLQVLLNDDPVPGCTQNFGDAAASAKITAEDLRIAAQATVVCSIDTRRFNFNIENGQGVPVFANDDYTIRAVLSRNGEELDAASTGPFTFANEDFTVVEIEAADFAISPETGLLWHTGPLTVTAVPVIFTGAPVSELFFHAGATTREGELGEEGFTFTFPLSGPGNIGNITDDSFNITTSSIRSNGQPGPAGDSNDWLDPLIGESFRLDTQAPNAGILTLPNDTTISSTFPRQIEGWINEGYAFSRGHGVSAALGGSGIAPEDAGVQGLTVTYHVAAVADFTFGNASSLSTAERAAVVANGIETATGAGLDETINSEAYVVVARVADALGNVSTVQLTVEDKASNLIGVDNVAPEIDLAANSPANMAINPGTDYTFAVSDDNSGFGADELIYRRAVIQTPAISGGLDACFIGDFSSVSGCRFENSASSVVENAELTDEAYYTIEVFTRDRAGNRSETITRLALVDTTDPTVSNVAIPSVLVGGQPANFAAIAEDNLNLGSASFFLNFGGERIQFEPSVVLGSFGPAFDTETRATLSTSGDFIRGLMDVDPADHRPTGLFTEPSGAAWEVLDLAGNDVFQENGFGFVRPGGAVDPFADIVEVVATITNATVCSPTAAACGPTNDPTSTSIGVKVVSNTAIDRPFERIVLVHEVSAGEWHFVGQSTAASVSDAGGVRTWTFSGVTYTPEAGLLAGDDQTLRVIGITSDGDAIRTNDAVIAITNP